MIVEGRQVTGFIKVKESYSTNPCWIDDFVLFTISVKPEDSEYVSYAESDSRTLKHQLLRCGVVKVN